MTLSPQDIPPSAAYQAIEQAFTLHAAPHHYYRDFSHWDRSILAHNPSRFMWILGHCYTNTLLYRSQESTQILEYRLNKEDRPRVYGFEGGALRELSDAEARAFLQTLPPACRVTDDLGFYFIERGQERVMLGQEEGQHLSEQQCRSHLPGDTRWDCRALFSFLHQLDTLWDSRAIKVVS